MYTQNALEFRANKNYIFILLTCIELHIFYFVICTIVLFWINDENV